MSEKVLIISPKGEERYLNAAVWNRVKQNSQFAGWVESGDYEGGTSDKIITKLPPEVEEMQRRMMEQTKTIVEVKPAEQNNEAGNGGVSDTFIVDADKIEPFPIPVNAIKTEAANNVKASTKPEAKKQDSGKAQPVAKKKAEK